jgi:hypothetical protein
VTLGNFEKVGKRKGSTFGGEILGKIKRSGELLETSSFSK